MKKKYMILVTVIVFVALPALAVVRSNSFNQFLSMAIADIRKCSPKIEGLELCTSTPKLVVNSGEPIRLKLSWVNSSDKERWILRASSYDIVVTDEKGKKLIPVLERKIQQGAMTNEDKNKFVKLGRGRDRTLFMEANQTERDEVWLTESYDYNFNRKGKYYVSVSKTIPSLDNNKTVRFVIDNIEIQVK